MAKRRKLYSITFTGSWLGGKAIVRAVSEEVAIAELRKTFYDPDWKIVSICKISDRETIIYYDDGDY